MLQRGRGEGADGDGDGGGGGGSAAPTGGDARHSHGGVTLRAVGLGLCLSALFCAITPYNDFKVAATFLSGTYFPISALFVLLVLAGAVNPLLRRLRPASAFSRGELLTVWTLILVSSGIPGSGLMRFLIPHIVAPRYYSGRGNDWEPLVWGTLPPWLTLTDKEAARTFFEGLPRGQERIPWEAWAQPLFFWGVLAALFLLASFCVAALLRRQWVENERFSFPLVQLPLLLTEDPPPGRAAPPLLRSPLLWAAVLLTTTLHALNGVHRLYPTVPEVRTAVNLMEYLTAPPWNQLAPFDVFFFPLAVGLAYLLPREVSFSLWFFLFFFKGEVLLGAVYNWDMPGALVANAQKQFHGLQVLGGALGLTAWTLWTARRHLADVWEKATGGPRAAQIDDSREMLPYRFALLGLAASYAGIGYWLYRAAVPVPMAALSLLLLSIIQVTVSWMVCQAGMLFTSVPFGTMDALGATLGTTRFPVPGIYSIARFEAVFFPARELLTPSLLNGVRAGDAGVSDARRLTAAMAASVALGFVVSGVASLSLPYHNGGANLLPDNWTYRGSPQLPLRFSGGVASVPYAGSWTNGLHVAGGLAGVLGLLTARARLGAGLHPIGFLVASVYPMRMLWFSMLAGWAVKTLVLRFGGMKSYAGALPFFLGLIVGDALNAALWIGIGYLTGVGYRLMPA